MSGFVDKYEIRRQNLLRLRDDKCNGRSVTLAEKISKSTAYVARLLAPIDRQSSKVISEKTADHITECFKLPKGWLDIAAGHTIDSATPSFVIAKKCITDYNEEICSLQLLDKPIKTLLPPYQDGLSAFQVLTDKYYPRIKYGEFIITTNQDKATSGTSALILFNSQKATYATYPELRAYMQI